MNLGAEAPEPLTRETLERPELPGLRLLGLLVGLRTLSQAGLDLSGDRVELFAGRI